jgi:hypothetical protein
MVSSTATKEAARKAMQPVAGKVQSEASLTPASSSPPVYGPLPFPNAQYSSILNSIDTNLLAAAMQKEFAQSKASVFGVSDDAYEHLLFLKPEIIEAARKEGKKHILFEWPYHYQAVADKLWEGKITPEQYVQEYREVNKQHSTYTHPAYLASVKKRAEESANLVVRAREAGIKVGFIDPEKDTHDKLNPHTGCIQGYAELTARYNAAQENIFRDFNRSRGKAGGDVEIRDFDAVVQFALDNKEKYRGLLNLREEYTTYLKQRLTETNKTMAQLAMRQTHGEPFYLAVGSSHTEGIDAVQSYLKMMGYNPRVTALKKEEWDAGPYYAEQASKGSRWFLERDFTNAPDSVLLLSGKDKKPEFFTIPPAYIEKAKQLTLEGGYANPKPITPPEPLNIDSASLVAPNGAFAKSLTCETPQRTRR